MTSFLPMKITTFFCSLCFTLITQAQRDYSKVWITCECLADNVYGLLGSGGNIGLAIGQTEAFVNKADRIVEFIY